MRKTLLVATIILSASACQQEQEPENHPGSPSTVSAGKGLEASAGVAPQQIGDAKVTFEPAVFEDCAPPKFVVATISWDARLTDAKQVDVKILNADGTESLFVTDGPSGSNETGPWVGPKAVAVLRDHDTGAELGRGIAGSIPCRS